MSWNVLYAGKHYTVRQNEANRVHSIVREGIDPEQASICQNRVDIIITTFFGHRPIDSCNVATKMYIDGLIGWYIEDDSIKYVRSSKSVVEMDRDRPRVEIKIIETDEPVWKKLP